MINASETAITGSTHIANINPIRYRGYYYDVEIGFYYCNSRYYDPEVGGFIDADVYTSTEQGFGGYNMFAYCLGNPVQFSDSSGERSKYFDQDRLSGSAGFGATTAMIGLVTVASMLIRSNQGTHTSGVAIGFGRTRSISIPRAYAKTEVKAESKAETQIAPEYSSKP